MRLGIYSNTAELQKTREWIFKPNGYEYVEGEDIVKFHLRPWTRTTQGIVDKKAKAKNIAIMDADAALKGVGVGDKKAEAYTRELADFLIAEWENVIAAGPVFYVDKKGKLPDAIIDFYEGNPTDEEIEAFVDGHPELIEFRKNDPLPCISRFKVLLFEDVQIAVDIVKAAQSFATLQVSDEAKNAERSSDGTLAPESSPNLTSA
jgi:hypothetical protein